MSRKPKRPAWKQLRNASELFDELASLRLPEDYNEQDRARDFLAVFNGESDAEQGRRVLSMINNYCNTRPSENLSDSVRAFRDGRRDVPEFIIRCMVPRDPVSVEREPKKED